MRTYFDEKPEKLTKSSKGKFRYHWDIESFTDDEGDTKWVSNEVIVNSPLTRSELVRIAINSLWDKDYEMKLVNEYLEETQSSEPDPEVIERYASFLAERKRLKEIIAEDCIELGIPDV